MNTETIQPILQCFTMVLLGGIVNRMRGTGSTWLQFGSKGWTSLAVALSTYFICDATLEQTGIIFLGILSWLSMGWGKYFVAYNGLPMNHGSDPEVKWIDKICKRIGSGGFHYNCNVGWLAMTLRGLYFLPMTLLLALYEIFLNVGIWWVELLKGFSYGISLAILHGLAYTLRRWSKENHKQGAEWVVGWGLGAALAIMLLF